MDMFSGLVAMMWMSFALLGSVFKVFSLCVIVGCFEDAYLSL